MVTVAHLVKKRIRENTFLLEAMSRDIISFANLAEKLKPEIEAELGKKIQDAAIVMALRRYAEELHSFDKKIAKKALQGEIVMRTNVVDFNVVKSASLLSKLKNLYAVVDYERGDTFNIILSNNEVSIITNEKYALKIQQFLKGEKLLDKKTNLVSVTLIFFDKTFFNTPGFIFSAVRKLSWEHVNIYEIVSTMTELTFILSNKDSMKAYTVLQDMIGITPS